MRYVFLSSLCFLTSCAGTLNVDPLASLRTQQTLQQQQDHEKTEKLWAYVLSLEQQRQQHLQAPSPPKPEEQTPQ